MTSFQRFLVRNYACGGAKRFVARRGGDFRLAYRDYIRYHKNDELGWLSWLADVLDVKGKIMPMMDIISFMVSLNEAVLHKARKKGWLRRKK